VGVPRIPQPLPVGATPSPSRRRDAGQGSVLALQRSIGNHAVGRLLQRDPTRTEVLSKAAKELHADSMVNDVAAAGVEEKDIGYARQILPGKPGIKPGLNIVENLGARGRTGFVAADGTYLGDTLPAATPELPRIAISIGSQAFTEGAGAVRATLRHELEHAMHNQLLILVQRDWRESLKKAGKALPKSEDDAERQLFAFAAGDKLTSTHAKPSAAELSLIRGATKGHLAETELLAHLAGFMAVFETTPPAGPKGILGIAMAPALEQLRGAAQHGWPGANDTIKAEAKARIVTYYKSLADDKKLLLRDWLLYLREHIMVTWPAQATDDDAKAARYVQSKEVFGPHREFLEWILGAIREVEFAGRKLPAPANRAPVRVTRRPKAAATVPVGAGTVKVYIDIGYEGMDTKPHGFSVSYDGADAADVRWLQLIWREVVPEGGKGVTGTWKHQTSSYPLTTDPGEPSQVAWNTDTAAGYRTGEAASAFYENENSVNRDAKHVEMFDEPSSPYDSMVKAAFDAGRAGGKVTGKAHLVQYLVKGMDVLFRSEVEVGYTYKQASDNPDATPKLISAGKAASIDPVARARLHEQFSSLDFLL
jgi:hypothetical protein